MPTVRFSYCLPLLLSVLVLAACGGSGGGGRAQPAPPPELSMEYSYPINNQEGVPLGADVIVKLNLPVSPEAAMERFLLIDEADEIVVASPEVLGNNDILRFDPEQKLDPGTRYRVVYQVAEEVRDEWLAFTTKLVGAGVGGDFSLIGRFPVDPNLPFLDIETIRLRFTAFIDPDSVRYGAIEEGGTLELTGPEGVVPATVKVEDNRISLDPVEDLEPGVEYTVRLSSGLHSLAGIALDETTISLTPSDTGNLAEQRLQLTPSGVGANLPNPSALVGQRLNTMVLESNIIGVNQLALSGVLDVHVGDPTVYENLIPFTIRKGQLAGGEALDIRLGGSIPSGLETGPIFTEFLTDATGYFFRNPYTSEGPVMAVLFMDLGVTATNPVEQGMVNAEILHVQAVGTLDIVQGRMMSEMYGSMELSVLGGLERGTVKFNMRLEGPDEGLVLMPTPPRMEIVSSYPGQALENYPNATDDFFMVDDTILVNFTSGIDPQSLVKGENVVLMREDVPMPHDSYDVDSHGATLMIDPVEALEYGREYSLLLRDGITAVTGEIFRATETLTWTTPTYVENPDVAPQLIALKPGAPCALVDGNVFAGGTVAGRCAGGAPDDLPYELFEAHGADIVTAHFTMPMRQDTLVYGDSCGDGTVRVEIITDSGECTGVVPGYARVTEREITFVPNEPWTEGQLYRVVLESSEIRGINGLALNSNPLAGEAGDGGTEPTVEMPFIGRAEDNFSLQPLLARPFSDINGDFELNDSEVMYGSGSINLEVEDIAGNVTFAEFVDHDGNLSTTSTSYLNYVQLVEIGEIENNRIPVRVTPQYQIGTAVNMRSFYLALVQSDVNTGPLILRPHRTYTGYIEPNPNGRGARFVLNINLYIDAPYPTVRNTIFGHEDILGLFEFDAGIDERGLLQSQVVEVTLSGPVYNLPDGRIALDLANQEEIRNRIDIQPNPSVPEFQTILDMIGIDHLPSGRGRISLIMRPGDVRLRLVGPPLKGLGEILGAR